MKVCLILLLKKVLKIERVTKRKIKERRLDSNSFINQRGREERKGETKIKGNFKKNLWKRVMILNLIMIFLMKNMGIVDGRVKPMKSLKL